MIIGMANVSFKPTADIIESANKLFEEQQNRIKKRLPYADVQHIGSTAIPNSVTKGDVDIVVRVSSEEFAEARGALMTLYKINQKGNWTDIFASFKDDKSFSADLGVQLVVENSKSDDFVKIRDAIRENPDMLKEYNEMKQRFENKDMEEYRKEKAKFFQKLRERFT